MLAQERSLQSRQHVQHPHQQKVQIVVRVAGVKSGADLARTTLVSDLLTL